MKLYYDADDPPDETPNWTEVTAIFDYPTITSRNNSYGMCTVVLRDFEGGLYSTWEPRDFTPMKLEDDSSNVLFRGFLINKTYTATTLILELAGFAILLDWVPFYKSYILEEGKIASDPIPATSVLEVYDDADDDDVDDGAAENFGWAADYWITDQNVGLLIVDNTKNILTKEWTLEVAPTPANHSTLEAGDEDSFDARNDNDTYYITETGTTWDATITTTDIGGDQIADTVKLHKIEIHYRFGYKAEGIAGTKKIEIQIDKNGSWQTAAADLVCDHYWSGEITNYRWISGTHTIEDTDTELAKYFDKDVANYDQLKGVRFVMWYSGGSITGHLKCDELRATIHYYAHDITPIMSPITDSAAETLTCSALTWDETGVATNDIWKIGENTVQIVDDISDKISIPIDVIGQTVSGGGTFTLRPDGDDTKEWLHTDSGGDGSHWKDLDEVVVDPNAGDTFEIYTTTTLDEDIFTMGTDVLGANEVVTKIELHVYGKKDGVLNQATAYFSTPSTGWSSLVYPVSSIGAYAWKTSTWDNLALDQADLDGLKIKFLYEELVASGGYFRVDCFYLTVTYGIYSPFEKYIATQYRGTHCIDVLNAVCKLEGAAWVEDYDLYRLKIVKPTTYEDSTVTLTEDDYGFDWEFEDKCNQVKRVDVWGQASYNIHEYKTSSTATGVISTQIIDETITTAGGAEKLAESEIGRLEAKRPSIKLPLLGTRPNLQLGKYVNVTFARPTIAAADYPIRMIERKRVGADILTIIYCGLGETKDDEKIGTTIKKIGYLANKGLADRLISTPWTSGASISWSDVGGADAAVNALITAAGHITSANVEAYLAIGAANKRWVNLPVTAGVPSRMQVVNEVYNVAPGNMYVACFIPIPYVINGKNLTITQTKIGISDSDANDFVDQIIWYGTTDETILGAVVTIDHDGDKGKGTGEFTHDHADITVGGTYEQMILILQCANNASAELGITGIQMEYYYA